MTIRWSREGLGKDCDRESKVKKQQAYGQDAYIFVHVQMRQSTRFAQWFSGTRLSLFCRSAGGCAALHQYSVIHVGGPHRARPHQSPDLLHNLPCANLIITGSTRLFFIIRGHRKDSHYVQAKRNLSFQRCTSTQRFTSRHIDQNTSLLHHAP